MLRAKHISPLSKCARTFLFNGSKCSVSDGGSCAYSEDETFVSKRSESGNEVISQQSAPTVESKTLESSSPSLLVRTSKRVSHVDKINDVVQSPSVAASTSASTASSLLGSDAVITRSVDAADLQHALINSSAHVVDQFVKSSIVAIGFVNDLLNYRLPTSDGNGILSPYIRTVDSTRHVSNAGSSVVKPLKRERLVSLNENPLAEFAGTVNPATNFHAPKGKAEKYRFVKALDHASGKVEKTIVTHGVSLDTQSQKYDPQQRSKAYSYGTGAKSKAGKRDSKPKVTEGASEPVRYADNILKPVRVFRALKESAPSARQFMGSEHVVDNVYNVLQQLRWSPATEKTLKNLNSRLDAYQANRILKQLQDHNVALGFFYWLKCQPWFKHDEYTYTTMVGIIGRARQFDVINSFLDEMVSDGCMPNVVTYNRLIHSYGRANYIDEAMNVYYQMQEAGCTPDRVTFSTLIDIHAKAGYLDVALDLYRRMQEAGLSPDTFTYSVMINCLGKAGHVNAAYKLFCEMVAQGCVPNLVTYNIMIALQAKARNFNSVLKLYHDMQSAGFEPDKVTYNIIMEVFGHLGYLDKAEAVVVEMKRKNSVPDEPVYGLLVDLWGKAGNVDKALSWYRAMLDDGLRPNVPTCNSLLSAFLRVHRFSDSYNLLQSMLNLGLQPSLQTYTLLLSCCTDTRSHVDMNFCCGLMEITGHPAHTFLLSMPAAGPDGQNVRDHASTFLDTMHSENRESKRGLLDAVINFLHKSGLKEEAGSVWEVAAQRNLYPDVLREKNSSYWLINLHVMSDGTAVTALSRTLAWFRRQMIVSGIGPRRIDIVTGWGRRSRVTGSSLVRHVVQELLHVFGFPFFTENGNSGCFVGCGEHLNRWLHQSYVERMHLL
ncbi:hypothetical protein Scep_021702 [Stephania cephalantha]|uniref:Smr domain-containing protein n=1 Tax=Stephania cephalantha TaxID=152367 RepID=A0AAP0FBX6_9MAGN